MRALLITYRFAPNAKVGAKRMSSLTYHSINSDIQWDVVTPMIRYLEHLDPTLLEGASTVYRTRMNLAPYYPMYRSSVAEGIFRKVISKIANIVYEIDNWQGGNKYIIRQCHKVMSDLKYDVVVSSGPPFSAFLAAEEIADEYNLPLVLDYRDPWTGYQWSAKSISDLQRESENRIVSKAKGVVLCSEGIHKEFIRCFGAGLRAKTFVITNGYQLYTGERVSPDPDYFNIVHAGSLYGERTLSVLGESMNNLSKKYCKPILLHHWGYPVPQEEDKFKQQGLSKFLKCHSMIPRSNLMPFLAGADVLYLSSGSDVKYALPFKVFDYMSTGIPILALAPRDSEVSRFIDSNNLGITVSNNQPAALTAALEKCLSLRTKKPPESCNWHSVCEKYCSAFKTVLMQ